ncbi:uncharacterized protein [Palaemon carinicauda]|uniref:uncharacterized protein n=1 Tax=Palaemon carinicauda TaxID=392227 RepID=UPI0035B60682
MTLNRDPWWQQQAINHPQSRESSDNKPGIKENSDDNPGIKQKVRPDVSLDGGTILPRPVPWQVTHCMTLNRDPWWQQQAINHPQSRESSDNKPGIKENSDDNPGIKQKVRPDVSLVGGTILPRPVPVTR